MYYFLYRFFKRCPRESETLNDLVVSRSLQPFALKNKDAFFMLLNMNKHCVVFYV